MFQGLPISSTENACRAGTELLLVLVLIPQYPDDGRRQGDSMRLAVLAIGCGNRPPARDEVHVRPAHSDHFYAPLRRQELDSSCSRQWRADGAVWVSGGREAEARASWCGPRFSRHGPTQQSPESPELLIGQ